ncbi:MAG: hypothetical protein DRR08_32410, partial [Candidatus Parabeggiatoa sp. nov. 2]
MSVILNKRFPVIPDTGFKPPKKWWQGSLMPWLMTGALVVLPLHMSAGELIPTDLLDNEEASVIVQNEPSLLPSWQAAAAKGINLKPIEGTALPLKTQAQFTGIQMNAADSQSVNLKVAAFEPMPSEGTSREYPLSTQEGVNGGLVGGVDHARVTRAQDIDTDGDGIKDINDEDDDNDCRPDAWEIKAGLNPLDPADGTVASTVPFDTIPASAKVTVDFEKMLGSRLTPGMEITNQFDKTHGVTFSSSKAKVILIKVGKKPIGFISVYDANGRRTRRQNKLNRPAPSANIGQFLVMAKHPRGADLTLTYRQPVAQASGDILDVDGREALTIIASNAKGKVLSRKRINKYSPNSGDGRATRWSFKMKAPVIKTVKIVQRGRGLGVAFDNFSASPLCGVVKPKPPQKAKKSDTAREYAFSSKARARPAPTTTESTIRYVLDLKANVSDQFEAQVSNPENEPTNTRLVFEEQNNLLDKAETKVLVDLGPLFERWQTAGAKGVNIKTIDDGPQIQLVKT